MAWRNSIPQPRMEPMPPAVDAWSVNHWITKEVLKIRFLKCFLLEFCKFLHFPSENCNFGWLMGIKSAEVDFFFCWGFPDSSVGKESAYNTGDPGSILGLGRSPGEGIGCPLKYSWASLVAQLVKNLPATRETWVWSLRWEDPLEKGKATQCSILAGRIPWTVSSMCSQRVRHD